MLIQLIKILFSALVIVLLLDPADRIFYIKTPLFILILLFWLFLKAINRSKIKFNKDVSIIIGTFTLISLFGIMMAFIQNTDVDYTFSIGFIKSISILLILYVVIDLGLKPELYLNRYAILIPMVTFPVYIFSFYDPSLFEKFYTYLVSDKNSAMLAQRSYYGYDILMVYYKTSPILVFPLSHFCNKLIRKQNKWSSLILSLIFFFSLIVSGTRANMLSAILIVLYYIYRYVKEKKNALYSIASISIVFTIIISFLLTLSLKESDESSVIKYGHYSSFKSNIEDNPQYLIWGQGLGSKFYSEGIGAFTAQTELTYFDLVRFFGIPLTILFLCLIFYPIIYLYINKKINKETRYIVVAYIAYLFIAGTNPLLISSTGMLILMAMYSFLRRDVTNTHTQLL